jgi:hypothetical protein
MYFCARSASACSSGYLRIFLDIQSRLRSVGASRTRCPSTREHMSYEAAPGGGCRPTAQKKSRVQRGGLAPRGVSLATDFVVREGLKWGWVVLVRSAAGHGRLKLGERLLEIRYIVGDRWEIRLEKTCICGGCRRGRETENYLPSGLTIRSKPCPFLHHLPFRLSGKGPQRAALRMQIRQRRYVCGPIAGLLCDPFSFS